MKIKKGQCFLCVKDYVMEVGWVAYTAGNEYYSEINGCITDNEDDVEHRMNDMIDFNEYFELINL